MGGGEGFALHKDTGRLCLQERLHPAPVARFSKEAELPVSFTTLLYPYPARATARMRASPLELDAGAPRDCSATVVQIEGGTDTIVFGRAGTAISDGGGRLTLHGEALPVRAGGAVRAFFWVNGTSASLDGQPLASAERPCSIRVAYEGESVRIAAEQPEPTLAVNTRAARFCAANGGARVAVKPGTMFRPFARP